MANIKLFSPLLGVLVMLAASPGMVFSQDLGPALRFTLPEQRIYVAPFEKAPDGKITIEFRFKMEEAGSGYQNLVGDGEGFEDFCFKVYFYGSTRKIYAYLMPTPTAVLTAMSPEIVPGFWYHLAYIADGSRLKLYLNGEWIAEIPYAGNLVNKDNAFFIGSEESENAPRATIDEIRIWNTARTEQEINDWMHRRIDPGDPGFTALNAYWRLDEGIGNTATDMTENHRDGTIEGGPKWVGWEACDGDFKGDGFVDGLDLVSFINVYGWKNCGSDEWTCPGDFNTDGNINELDLILFADYFVSWLFFSQEGLS
jgi:hypothetical protein